MDSEQMLEELERASESLGIKILRRDLASPEGMARSGLVKLRGSPVIIMHYRLSKSEQVEVIVESIRNFDLENIYLSPACRLALEDRPEQPA